MSLPRTVADVLRQHVTLEVEGIDRMYLNVCVPTLQCAGGVACFFRFHRGHQFASSVLMDSITHVCKWRLTEVRQWGEPDHSHGRGSETTPYLQPCRTARQRAPCDELRLTSRGTFQARRIV